MIPVVLEDRETEQLLRACSFSIRRSRRAAQGRQVDAACRLKDSGLSSRLETSTR